ncbi:hypothetical protein [Blastococcus goldschmidtiae]|uniref:EVE domain-containing protein n=1 Tax=Blastococcus goldschmidtiae TaxID=3075546 RepID=A0ABU2KBI1_9ACTN|nr:hypothetical protein [Blastococcus sp. DSM 46792]MDT0277533.1 hypothetical protein [Blastococcus sp. DSM 46792]
MARLHGSDVAAWLLKSTRPPAEIVPGWAPGEERELTRCVRRSYRLELVSPGQPVVLWVSGRASPGVHAVGTVTGPVRQRNGDDDGPVLPVRLTHLPDPVERGELLADPGFRTAEVLRMPAGSNPSWLSTAQLASVQARAGLPGLGPWVP